MSIQGLKQIRYSWIFFILFLSLIGCGQEITKPPAPQEPAKPEPIISPSLSLRTLNFEDLQGWLNDDLVGVIAALKSSCRFYAIRPSATPLNGVIKNLTPADFTDACNNIPSEQDITPLSLHRYFETYFQPYEVWRVETKSVDGVNKQEYSARGLFTGYYESELEVSYQPNQDYKTPIWGLPDDLIRINLGDFDQSLKGKHFLGRIEGKKFIPYSTRGEIEGQAEQLQVQGNTPILWAKDPLDLFILHIQGSGRGILPNKEVVRLHYAGNNGHNYRSIGKVLIDRGILTADQAGWRQIRNWLVTNPDQAKALYEENPRYIFFRASEDEDGPFGSMNQALTPMRSMAVDTGIIPLGVPIWLNSNYPSKPEQPLQRLMLAHDTGNAIRGIIRGDFFWGHGEKAEIEAGRMKSYGSYSVLLPLGFKPDAGQLLNQETIIDSASMIVQE